MPRDISELCYGYIGMPCEIVATITFGQYLRHFITLRSGEWACCFGYGNAIHLVDVPAILSTIDTATATEINLTRDGNISDHPNGKSFFRVLEGVHTKWISHVIQLNDGKLVSNAPDMKICVWDPADAKLLAHYDTESIFMTKIVARGRGFVGYSGNRLSVWHSWDEQPEKIKFVSPGWSAGIAELIVSDAGAIILSLYGNTLAVLDEKFNIACQINISNLDTPMVLCQISPKCFAGIGLSGAGGIGVRDIATLAECPVPDSIALNFAQDIVLDNGYLLIYDDDGTVLLFNSLDAKPIAFRGRTRNPCATVIDAGRANFAILVSNAKVEIWG